MNEEIITSLDIGSSKIFGVTGLIKSNEIEVIGASVLRPSEEIVKKGKVVDIEGLSNYLYELFEDLKKQAGERPEWIIVGIGGGFLKGKIYQKKINIDPPGKEITELDVFNLEREIKQDILTELDGNSKIIHCIPQEYMIDDSKNITKPVGLHGNILEGKFHILKGMLNPIQDIIKSIKNAGAEVEKIFPHSWAMAESTSTEEERKLGCLVIDFGKGTTDVSFYLNNTLILTESFLGGGGNIDGDISIMINTPISDAEELKKNYGWCNYPQLLKERRSTIYQKVEILGPSGKRTKQVSIEKISKIVYDRVKDIFENYIKASLQNTSFFSPNLIGGGVIISGGSARLKGLMKFSEEVFGIPTRMGMPKKMLGLDREFLKPEFSVGIGLLLLGSKEERKNRKKTPFWIKIKEGIKKWF